MQPLCALAMQKMHPLVSSMKATGVIEADDGGGDGLGTVQAGVTAVQPRLSGFVPSRSISQVSRNPLGTSRNPWGLMPMELHQG